MSAAEAPQTFRERLLLGRLAGPAAVAGLLGIARLLPETGFGLWLRLAAATLVVLLPGRLLARSLGRRSLAATFAWSVALTGGGLALAFALGTSLDVALAFMLGAGALALAVQVYGWVPEIPPPPVRARVARGFLIPAGLIVGGAVWAVQGSLYGDAFFHLGRIRKLETFGSLSLHDVGEFVHGSLHPGYAFPVWHGWIALVAKLAGVDPASAAPHESSLLVPVALVLAFEMGWAVFQSTGLAFAVVLGTFALKCLSAGHAGVYTLLWEPGTAASQLLAPAAIALFFGFVRTPSWPLALTLAVDAGALALIHTTYALFLLVPLTAYVVARLLLARGAELRQGIAALAAFVIPMALAVAWLKPVLDQTVALNLTPKQLARSLQHYRFDLVIRSPTRYSLAPGRVDRTGTVAFVGLLLTPLALLARHRRWAALVLGGMVTVLTIELWPLVFPHFANAVSLSQARRAATFLPFAVAFAGGIWLVAGVSRVLVLALAVGGGIWLQRAYPGDFGLRAPVTESAIPIWIALYGGAAALALGTLLVWLKRDAFLRLDRRRGVTTLVAALAFVVPVAVNGFSHWTPARAGTELTPGLIHFLQHDVPPRSVLFSDLETSYEAIAYAPVYAVAVPPSHAAETKQNELFKRRRAVQRFFAHPSVELPRRWNAGWLILRRDRVTVPAIEAQGLKPVYVDRHFVVFELSPPPVPLAP